LSKPTLVIADDEMDIALLVQSRAALQGFEARIVADGKELMRVLSDSEPDVIVLDIVMPNMDGIEVLNGLVARDCQAIIILISGYDGRYIRIANDFGLGRGLNILGALTKPFRLKELDALLTKAYPEK